MTSGDRSAQPASGPPDSDLDAQIVGQVLGGNRDAYGLLVRKYQEALFRFAVGMVGNPDNAADLVQDSLVKAFMKLDGCRDPARFGAWIHRIVRNRCLDHLKSRSRGHLTLDDAVNDLAVDPEADQELERSRIWTTLNAALATLPVAQREAFLMKHLEDRPYEEMAEMLGASISALKMRVKRAREALQSSLVDSS